MDDKKPPPQSNELRDALDRIHLGVIDDLKGTDFRQDEDWLVTGPPNEDGGEFIHIDTVAKIVDFALARAALSSAVPGDRDALRWRFFEEHAQSDWQGRKLIDWLGFDGVMKYGSRNAAIDAAMAGAEREQS